MCVVYEVCSTFCVFRPPPGLRSDGGGGGGTPGTKQYLSYFRSALAVVAESRNGFGSKKTVHKPVLWGVAPLGPYSAGELVRSAGLEWYLRLSG